MKVKEVYVISNRPDVMFSKQTLFMQLYKINVLIEHFGIYVAGDG